MIGRARGWLRENRQRVIVAAPPMFDVVAVATEAARIAGVEITLTREPHARGGQLRAEFRVDGSPADARRFKRRVRDALPDEGVPWWWPPYM